MTDKYLYLSLGLFAGLVLGLIFGYRMGFDVGTQLYPKGIETVWLNDTAGKMCDVSYTNRTAEIRCSP